MTPREVLIAARAKISDPANWIKGYFANDEHGDVLYNDPDACRFCALGAVWHLGVSSDLEVEADRMLDKAAKARGFDSVIHYNDAPTTTHEDILSLYDEVIGS